MRKNNYNLTDTQMDTIVSMIAQNPKCGIYGIKTKALFSNLEGEEDEWEVRPAHDYRDGDGKEGICLVHLAFDEDYEDWEEDEHLFYWFPSNWCYGKGDCAHLVFEIIYEAPFMGDIKIFQRECIKAGGASKIQTGSEECCWKSLWTNNKCGMTLYNTQKYYCLRLLLPYEVWKWENDIPYYIG